MFQALISALLSLAGIGVVLAVALAVTIWRAFFTRLASVPGPAIARFTDLWYAYRIYRGSFEKDNVRLHQKYGPVVRYGVNRFSIADPQAASIIYGPASKFTKSSWYQTWGTPSSHAWSLFSDQDAKRHASNRRQYQNTYSMSSLVHYESYVDECAHLFCQRLSEMVAGTDWSRPLDMGHWLQCYAFDVIGMITYSKRIGFLDFGEDVGDVMRNLGDHLAYASVVGVYPLMHPILFRVRNWLAGSRGKGRQFIVNFTQECMAAHQATPKAQVMVPGKNYGKGEEQGQTMDFLSKFVQKHSQDPAVFTTYHVLSGCVSNMVAGSDTTSISLSAILYHVLHNPGVLTKLRGEVDQHCPQNKASPHITFAQSQGMPYLQAVIKEALRMHPATGLPLERVVPEGGATISGVFFPEGAIVGINSWVEHNNKAIFGDDTDRFNPDRWLQKDKERIGAMNRHWMPFGLGSRTCIGRHISMLEMCKLVPRLVRDYDMELCNMGQWQTKDHWFVKPENFKVLVRPRLVGDGP
ncbi:cytochrome P450 [Parathielavia appendiculata]|uniref:Cytochrome P450 n=1 Tax=Parathielavia appendiculata TaxID=2587402 RepID=A0AAN6TXV0_9PEZI|nr:cytochrome P450 [Parathielavia appendiculata]